MTGKRKSILLLAVLLLAGAAAICKPAREISGAERRRLAQMPELSVQALWQGTYMEELETYFSDQFPAREKLRSLCGLVQRIFLGKRDVDGYYLVDGSIGKLDAILEEESVTYAAENLNRICTEYLKEADCYYAVIPDKNYFLAEQNGYPAMDYERLEELMQENLAAAEQIAVADLLEAEDYYRSDLHWRQERIGAVAWRLAWMMQGEMTEGSKAEETGKYFCADTCFYGGYAGASAMAPEPDELWYYWTDSFAHVTVYDYEKKAYVEMYQMPQQGSVESAVDAYDFYLGGARALLRIENPDAGNDSRLILFRDSFGSSLAPLLVEQYREILLVDLRYISLTALAELVDMESYDRALFLYHTGMLNHSASLRF